MLYATGMTDEDMAKPQIGISSVWYEGELLLSPRLVGANLWVHRKPLQPAPPQPRAESKGRMRA